MMPTASVTSDLEDIFGTSEPPGALIAHCLGPLSFRLGETSARGIAWRGVELIRTIDYPIRDENWGTLATRTIGYAQCPSANAFRWTREFETHDGGIAGLFELSAEADGHMALSLRLEIKRDVRLCRAGFTLLHPIFGTAGQPVWLRRADGKISEIYFPLDISPSQPAADFVAIGYSVRGASVEIEMAGRAFEMEDQRNWSDASYKTYPRTASFPNPYPLKAGDVVEQKLHLTFAGQPAQTAQAAAALTLEIERATTSETFPSLAVAMDSDWAAAPLPALLEPLRRVIRLDLRDDGALTRINFPELTRRARLDLELIVADDRRELTHQLERLAAHLTRLGVSLDHVIALPAAYLKSYQPKGPWPDGAAPIDAIRAARRAFPGAQIGGGALTNFTELNRCRPDASEIDYLTHGSSAIVHAADDESVFQTLEALPDIFRSAKKIAPSRPYRLGLFSIGMRGNPYGAGLSANVERLRRTMCAHDPRAQALFGAAWLVGVAAAAEHAGVELLTLASVGGPFAVADEATRLTPSFHLLAWMANMQGRPRLCPATGDKHLHAVAVEHDHGVLVLLANGAPIAKAVACAFEGQVALLSASDVKAAAADPNWTQHAARPIHGEIELPPYAVAFLDLPGFGGGSR